MKRVIVIGLILMLGTSIMAQKTPSGMVGAYDALADSILALKQAEANLVKAMLEGHYHGAQALMKAGKHDLASAEMALFANEGDNAIGGIRKRLLEGGHHHNAEGEAKGIYEPGFVIVTREAKADILKAVSDYRQAENDADRKKAWELFTNRAHQLLSAH